MTADAAFPFVQFEFGFLLGPTDGRYLLRSRPEDPPDRVVVLSTLGAPERRTLLRGRRGRELSEEEGPEPVPTARATLIEVEPFESQDEAERWLRDLRGDREGVDAEIDAAGHDLNAVLRAYRLAAADPYSASVSPSGALVWRIGYGDGQRVADGRFAAAWEPPRAHESRGSRRRRLSAPDERFAALVGGREQPLACEELILRARADLDASHPREAALQARIALECILAELDAEGRVGLEKRRQELEGHRAAIGEAANTALTGDPDEPLQETVGEVIGRMEAALRHRSFGDQS